MDRAQDAIAYLSRGNVSHISLDHDLGDQYLVGSGYEGKIPRLEWRCHSANPVGRKNMEKALESADNFWRRRTREADWSDLMIYQVFPDSSNQF